MNATKLNTKIIEKGFSISTIAVLMGIPKSSLYRKIDGIEPISIYDAMRMKELLDLTNEEALDIFLSEE